ncbi:MAG: hypothetical protein JKX79_13175 [Labilibaculum sp.]|nr:hypothetical protein [Labilibaculum sp.]
MRFVILIVLFFNSIIIQGADYKILLDSLEECIIQKEEYTQAKLFKIESLTNKYHLYNSGKDLEKEFKLCMNLFYEYQSFVYDSALLYIERAKGKAYKLKNPDLIAKTKIKQGFVLLSSGLFKEAIDTLQSIHVKSLPDSIKYEYYSVIARSYYDLADYNQDPDFMDKHIKKGNTFLDSALYYVPKNTNDFWAVESLRRMKMSDWEGAKYAFSYWIQNYDLPRHHYAIATSSLGYIYSVTGYPELAIEYLMQAAIADIITSTKETVALRNLANALFDKGEKKKAYRFIISALDDATYYNARHRKIEIASILPIIEGERLSVVEQQKYKLIIYIIALTILSVLVIIFSLIIYRQLKNITKTRCILQDTVKDLNEVNVKMMEASQIKDEYIGYFLNVNSEYIEKLDSFKKNIFRKVSAHQYDDVYNMLKHNSIKEERKLLFRRFDEIFLKLFPNFMDEFNQFFPEEEHFILKKNELLNPELRIFALIRLGIYDSEKIAKFLDFTVSTIYTYKTKVKSKSLYRENFEEKVMKIKAF